MHVSCGLVEWGWYALSIYKCLSTGGRLAAQHDQQVAHASAIAMHRARLCGLMFLRSVLDTMPARSETQLSGKSGVLEKRTHAARLAHYSSLIRAVLVACSKRSASWPALVEFESHSQRN